MARFRRRVTGVSWVGVQWEYKDNDREIARRVLTLLAGRRMLWKDFSLEIEEHCVRSADRVRDELGRHLENPEIGAELAGEIEALRSSFMAFMDEVGPEGDLHRRYHPGIGTDPLSMALGRLRGLVGVHIGVLASQYDLEVSDELATIVPSEAGWFFQRFI